MPGKHYDLDTDVTLSGNDDKVIASQKATKTYVDTEVDKKADPTIIKDSESEVQVKELVINKLTNEEYDAVTKENNQLYLTPDTTDEDIANAINEHNTSNSAHSNKVDKVSSTDDAIVKFDGTSGSIQNTGIIIEDNNDLKIGRYTYNVLHCQSGSDPGPREIVIHSKIQYANMAYMPVLRIYGYAYGLASPVELKLGFYIYDNKMGYCGAVSMGAWRPEIFIFKETIDSVDYVAFGFRGSVYFPGFDVDIQFPTQAYTTSKISTTGWTASYNNSNDTNIIPTDGMTDAQLNANNDVCRRVPYKSTLETLTINGTNYNGTSAVSINTPDTKNTAGSTDSSSKLFLIGATSQAANPQTYSHDTAFVDTNGRLNSAAPASNANDTTVATTKWVKDQDYAKNTDIPTVNDATLDIKVNGNSKGTFTANSSTDTTINITQDDLEKTKTYTGLIGTANNQANATFYFMTVRGTTWNSEWAVRYRIDATLDEGLTPTNYQYYHSSHECYITGRQGVYTVYANFNSHSSTSYRPIYYIINHKTTEAGYNAGYGTKLGVDLTSANSNLDVNYKRTIKITIFYCKNCTVTFNENPEIPPNSGRTDYNKLPSTYYTTSDSNSAGNWTRLNGQDNGLQESGDANTTYAYLVNTISTGATKIDANGYGARYSLIFATTPLNTIDERWSSLVNSSGNGTAKTALTALTFYIDRHPQYVYSANIAAGAASANALYQDFNATDARYICNTNNTYVTALKKCFLYLKDFNPADKSFKSDATIGNVFTLDKIATRFPSSTTGDVYIYFLGWTTSTWYNFVPAFTQVHKIFKYTPSTGDMVEFLCDEFSKKQNKLDTQTSYTSKGSATKVPQITTNTLGQVTNITEVDITHQSIKTLKTDNTTGQTASSSEAIAGSGTINLHKVSKTGSYNDLLNKPTIPTVNDKTITIQKNSTTVDSFTLNQSTDKTINITVPTKTSDITNDSGFLTEEVDTLGTVLNRGNSATTDINMNSKDWFNAGVKLTSYYYSTSQTPNTQYYWYKLEPPTSGSKADRYFISIDSDVNYPQNRATFLLDISKYSSSSYNVSLNCLAMTGGKNTHVLNVAIDADGYVYVQSDAIWSSYMRFVRYGTESSTISYTQVGLAAFGTAAGFTPVKMITDTGCIRLLNGAESGTYYTVLPSHYFRGDLVGNADTATKATKDGDGNTISTTYLKSHQSIKSIKSDNTTAQSTSSSEAVAGTGTINLHKIAKTGTFSDLLSKPTSLSGYGITDAYTKTEVDGMISSVYKPAGSVAFASLPTLSDNVLGNVYNVTDAFTTTANFVEGAGKSYPAGTNVVVVNTGTTASPTYKFDVLAGFVDLSGYVPTSRKVNGKALSADITISKSDVGLGNVDNTSDSDKPISTATQTALDGKENTISDLNKIRSGANSFYVKGTQTASTPSFTGVLSAVDELYEGLTIDYWLPFAGTTAGDTLNLTLADGSTTGPINCYYSGTTRLTTHLSANCVGRLIYQTVTISGTSYTGWWLLKAYYTEGSNTYDREYDNYYRAYAGSALAAYGIVMKGVNGRLYPLTTPSYNTSATKTVTTVGLRPDLIWLYNGNAACNAGAVIKAQSLYRSMPSTAGTYYFNAAVPTYCDIYLCGNYDENTGLFYLATTDSSGTASVTDFYKYVPYNTEPNYQDYFITGRYYIFLGSSYSTANYFHLMDQHPMYYFDGTNLINAADKPKYAVTFVDWSE